MKALIIAAGRGSRFDGAGQKSHKTLIPVCGVPLIQRIVSACGTIEEFVVVTGYRAPELEASLTHLLAGRARVRFVRNDQWTRANGVSALAAREALAGEKSFLLCMSDHLFEPKLAETLLTAGAPPDGCALAVDRDIAGVRDLEDATLVHLDGEGRINGIGKLLEEFDAVDTGVFLCTPALFEALEIAQACGGDSLSDGIRVLCERGRMRAVEVTGCLWQDVDNPEDLAEAGRRLWARVAKPRDGVVSRLVNRKISGWITRQICALPVTPNHVTLFNCAVAGAAAWLMATGNLLAGGVLAQAFSVLDGVDGELSRLKNMGSWFGGWLDNIADRLCDWSLIAGAALAVQHAGGSPSQAMLLAFIALVSNVCYWTAMDSLLVSGALRKPVPPAGILGRVERWFYGRNMVFGLTHDVYLLVLALGVALGFPRQTLSLLIVTETLWWSLRLFRVLRAAVSEPYDVYLVRESA
ncbi:NTP transferase domain-containing protein [bacterium]|nr:NTP transferase domain-containing protein [bacterium]